MCYLASISIYDERRNQASPSICGDVARLAFMHCLPDGDLPRCKYTGLEIAETQEATTDELVLLIGVIAQVAQEIFDGNPLLWGEAGVGIQMLEAPK